MPDCYLPSLATPDAGAHPSISRFDDRERLQVLIIGSRDGVIETIHTLHHQGFAEAGAWSPLLPAPNPDEVMSTLMRYRKKGA